MLIAWQPPLAFDVVGTIFRVPAKAWSAGVEAEPVEQHARDAAAAAQRLSERRRLAPAVARQLDVVGEQRLQSGEVTVQGAAQALVGFIDTGVGSLSTLYAGSRTYDSSRSRR